MKSFSVLLVIEGTFPWYRGGVSEWISQYLGYFENADFHILQVATDPFRNLSLDRALYPVPSNVKSFTRISPPEIKKNWESGMEQWWRLLQEKNKTRQEDIDCIHVANTGFAGYAGVKLAQRWDLPLVLTEHALYWKEVDHGAVALECGYKIPDEEYRDTVVDAFKNIARAVYRASDLTVSVSECNTGLQRKLGAVTPRHIPNGVPGEWITGDNSRSDTLTVGWIGRCAEMKNPLKFFDLADALIDITDDPVSFLMMLCDANEPELREEVEKKNARYPRVQVVWNEPARSHIDRMDALAVTSHNESQPLVLFEALARNVLPFGWKVGDVNEKFALAFDPDSTVEEVASGIYEYWSDRSRWNRELKNRHNRVKEEHTWENIFNRYSELFHAHVLQDKISHRER